MVKGTVALLALAGPAFAGVIQGRGEEGQDFVKPLSVLDPTTEKWEKPTTTATEAWEPTTTDKWEKPTTTATEPWEPTTTDKWEKPTTTEKWEKPTTTEKWEKPTTTE
ncbi:hypothetical protein ASPWEDRAFT_173336, partial [Aspergillus wentii DTO 134E9]